MFTVIIEDNDLLKGSGITSHTNVLNMFDEMTKREWSNCIMNYLWEEEEMKKLFYVSMVFDSSQGMGTTLTTPTIQFTALKVFARMHENELECTLTSGNAQEGWSIEANKLFDEWLERNSISSTKRIDIYLEKWESQFYTTYEHYKDGLGFDIIVFNTYDEWMSGLDINAPWSFIAHGMDHLEDLKLTNCYGYSDGMSSLLMHIMTWVFELASCTRTLQTTISQHVSKEEEHVFQLLIKKFTLEMQALLEIKVIATRVLKCKLWNFEDVITSIEFMGNGVDILVFNTIDWLVNGALKYLPKDFRIAENMVLQGWIISTLLAGVSSFIGEAFTDKSGRRTFQLDAKLTQHAQSTYQSLLEHIRSSTLKTFKEAFGKVSGGGDCSIISWKYYNPPYKLMKAKQLLNLEDKKE